MMTKIELIINPTVRLHISHLWTYIIYNNSVCLIVSIQLLYTVFTHFLCLYEGHNLILFNLWLNEESIKHYNFILYLSYLHYVLMWHCLAQILYVTIVDLANWLLNKSTAILIPDFYWLHSLVIAAPLCSIKYHVFQNLICVCELLQLISTKKLHTI